MQPDYPGSASDHVPPFSEPPPTPEQLTHFAYLQGLQDGRENRLAKAGLMAFGLTCATTPTDAENTRLYLVGFKNGLVEYAQSQGNAPDVSYPSY